MAPYRPRRIPRAGGALLMAVVVALGVGLAASLLVAGPSPFAPAASGNPTGGAPPTGGGNPDHPSPSPSPYPSPPTPYPNGSSNGTPGGDGGGGPGGGGSTGGGGHGSNGSAGSESGAGNGSTGGGPAGGASAGPNGTGTGNGSGGPAGSNGSRSNGTGGVGSTPPTGPTAGASGGSGALALVPELIAFLSLAALGLVLMRAGWRLPPAAGDPWAGAGGGGLRRRPRHRSIGSDRPLFEAARALRAELERMDRAPGGLGTGPGTRRTLIELYGRMLAAVGPPLGDLSRRTPREVEELTVERLGVARPTARELTGLFEEARYSTHPLTEENVRRGRRALLEIVDRLGREHRS